MNKKQDRGITLIALIITIIILLILVGMSVKVLEKGEIILYAKESTIRHQIAQIEEVLKIKLNDEGIVINTQENSEENDKYYTTFLYELISVPEYKVGNLYNKDTGELIVSNLRWFPTDIIFDKDEFFEDLDLKIKTDIGNRGYFSEIEKDISVLKQPKDIFLIDSSYNIYYIDERGKILYTSNKSYKLDKDAILTQGTYIDPDNLTGKNKEIYDSIYEGALAFTGDEKYARYLAINDIDIQSNVDAFCWGGYLKYNISKDNQIVELENGTRLENLMLILTRPDWTEVKLINDSVHVNYFMDNNYNMYKIDENDSNNIKVYDKDNNLLSEKIKLATMFADESEIKELTTENGTKYQYVERFDKKDIFVSIPDKEEVDMKTDLKDLNIYSFDLLSSFSNIKIIKFPDNVRNMNYTSLVGTVVEFEKALPNVEYIELPNNITTIYDITFKNCKKLKTVIMPDNIETIADDAFSGCDGVTVKFKDGKAPSGAPWGGTNITIESK